MHAEPAWAGLLDQVRPDQLAKLGRCPLDGSAGDRGTGIRVEVGAGMQAEQTECPGGRLDSR